MTDPVNGVLLASRTGDVETWTLNRPESRNALDPSLVGALSRQLSCAEDDGVRVVILTGAGAGFCAGADLAYLLECAQSGESPRPHLREICDLTLAMESSPIVFIAALHGFAVAGGLEIALACDLVIAAASTRIGDGHVKNNLVAGGGASVRMPPKLGAATAAWLALTGELVSAEDLARRTGWLHEVVAPDALLDTAHTMATVLTSRPAGAQDRYKRLIVNEQGATAAALTRELDMFDEHWNGSDVATDLIRFLGRSTSRSISKKERTVA
ncbi:enoyl-CoA hydratase/isomerase family protein [Nocardioides sp. NPDC127503]|uniref:enoyl-CoA hydratase/isomerase family protein n=1 Tax=Nocardioides sp. NPDC127503 TaxID=3154516 RepID=UPI003320CFD4